MLGHHTDVATVTIVLGKGTGAMQSGFIVCHFCSWLYVIINSFILLLFLMSSVSYYGNCYQWMLATVT